MWIITIAYCFVAASVYAQPPATPPTRTPTTPGSLITPATQEPPVVVGQEGCISTIQSQPIVQSSNDSFIVVTKRGRGRSFRDRHPELFVDPVIQSDGNGRDLPVAVVSRRQAETVRKFIISLPAVL